MSNHPKSAFASAVNLPANVSKAQMIAQRLIEAENIASNTMKSIDPVRFGHLPQQEITERAIKMEIFFHSRKANFDDGVNTLLAQYPDVEAKLDTVILNKIKRLIEETPAPQMSGQNNYSNQVAIAL